MKQGEDVVPDAPDEPLLDFSTQTPVQTPSQDAPSGPAPSAGVASPAGPSTVSKPTDSATALLPPATPERDQRNVLSLSPLGLLLGRVRLNYEQLFSDRHGFLLEAVVTPEIFTGFDFVSAGGGLGYRWYWGGPGSSGFVGGHLSFEQGSGRLKAVVDDKERVYEGRVRRFSLVPVIGKRWIFTEHFLMTARIGVGYASTRYIPDANANADTVENLRDFARKFPIAIEGELSLGYRF
jgi:hypothetical protein